MNEGTAIAFGALGLARAQAEEYGFGLREKPMELTAEQARSMRDTPYRLEEILSHIKSVAVNSNHVWGYTESRFPDELAGELGRLGYEILVDNGEVTIRW